MKNTTLKQIAIIAATVVLCEHSTYAGPLRDILQKRVEEHKGSFKIKENALMDVAYGKDKKQKMDIYLPNNPVNASIIVMVHGGAWKIGDKRMDRVVENKVARWNPKGVIFISINYRLLPDADPLKQAEDVANALAYVQRNGTKWGGDPRKVVLMGHSAGAHLVSLVSADPARYNNLKAWLGTVSLDSAAMNIPTVMGRKHYDFYDEAFGNDSTFWEAASPFHRLKSNAIDTMLVCSTERPDKPCDELAGYVQKAKSMGIRVEVHPEAKSHKEINEELGLESDYTKAVETFIRSVGIAL